MTGKTLSVGGTFQKGFQRYRQDKLFFDVIINVQPGASQYQAHKLLLAYSSGFFARVFKASATSNFAIEDDEQIDEKLKIKKSDIDIELDEYTAKFFKKVLKWLYTGTVKLNLYNVVELKQIAQKLEIPKLEEIVDQYLQASLNKQNAPIILHQALVTNSKDVIDQCLVIFARHFSHFVDIQFDFKQLPLEIMLQLLNHKLLFAESEAGINFKGSVNFSKNIKLYSLNIYIHDTSKKILEFPYLQ